MAWLIGIDEAGYGPNLGPFLMAGVACSIADGNDDNLWLRLKNCVRRKQDLADGRLWIEDSKMVYTPKKGVKELERSVLAFQNLAEDQILLRQLLTHLCDDRQDPIADEFWYRGDTPLPVQADHSDVLHCRERLQKYTQQANVQWAQAAAWIVNPPRFNGLIERWDSKAMVLPLGLHHLLERLLAQIPVADPVRINVDKHGGRDNYLDYLKELFPGAEVACQERHADRSVYQIEWQGRQMTMVFEPRADKNNFCVALASMHAKYLRELLMLEFNAFWQKHIPDLKPTAGYPTDALRFRKEIIAVVEQLGLDEKRWWRQR